MSARFLDLPKLFMQPFQCLFEVFEPIFQVVFAMNGVDCRQGADAQCARNKGAKPTEKALRRSAKCGYAIVLSEVLFERA